MSPPGTNPAATEKKPLPPVSEPSGVHRWNIWVSGYGTFEVTGTEAEAEERRAAKAQWEGAKGMKWRATDPRPSDAMTAEIVDLWDSGEGVPRSLLTARRAAMEAEATGQ